MSLEIGPDPEQNASIRKNINEALEVALAKLNSNCVGEDSDLNDVTKLLVLLLKYLVLIVPALTTVIGSTVSGLIHALKTKLTEKGFIGGLLGSVGGALHGITTGSIEGLSDYLKGLFT